MTDFDVMNKMSADNLDISMTGNITEIRSSKQGGLITFGVDAKTYNNIANQMLFGDQPKYYVAVYVVNKEQFDTIKAKDTDSGK